MFEPRLGALWISEGIGGSDRLRSFVAEDAPQDDKFLMLRRIFCCRVLK